MIKQEWKNIFHNTWIKVVLVALVAIPSIYSVIFLGSMWDPYGNSGDLPVAVVNEDKEVTYNGKSLNVGKELVDKLKDNDSLDFNFVNSDNANKGLKDGDYYMVITIPSNFSKNATTLLDDEPQKMVLNYTTNPGTNYVASKMDDSAIAKIKSEVSATVTKTYAETIFDSIGTMSDGFAKASDGTQELSDGMGELQSGNKTISDNLNVLAKSSLTFKDGADTLNVGLKTYTDGVSTVNSGAGELSKGLNTLGASIPTLTSGLSELSNGTSTLATGIKSYTAGTSQAYAGSKQLASNNTALNSGTKQIASGAKQLKEGNSQVVSGLTTVSTSLTKSMQSAANLSQLTGSNTSVKTYTQLFAAIKANPKLDEKAKVKYYEQVLNKGLSAAEAQALGIGTKDIPPYITTVNTLADTNNATLNTFASGVNDLNAAVNGGTMSNGTKITSGLLQGSKTVQAGLSNLDASLSGGTYVDTTGTKTIKEEDSYVKSVEKYTAGVTSINNGLKTLTSNNNKLNSGASQLVNGYKTLNSSIPTLTSGVTSLQNGATALKTGTQKLTANNSTLVSGTSQLASGASQISSGASKLAAGSTTLGNGLDSAAKGVDTLNTALKSGAKDSKINSTSKTNEMLSAPVDTSHKEVSKVENNGHAMAPYMMSVALYVTCLAFALMYPVRHGIKNAKSAGKYWASKATVMYAVSTIAAVVMITALRFINGFEPEQLGMTYLFAILVSAAFMSLVMLLSLTTGYIGDFLLLVIMIINLGGSAGTYPLETAPAIYTAIHKFVPYTYSVDGFRKVISMANASVSTEIMVFVGILVVCSLLTIVYFKYKNKEDKHLVPEMFEEVNGTKAH